MTTPDPKIPKVCLCGSARSGTSMMMRALQAGGLFIGDEDENPLSDVVRKVMRNPYGIFENFAEPLKGIFIKSFKLTHADKLWRVPRDYKFIFIYRNFHEIAASWEAIADECEKANLPPFPIENQLQIERANFDLWQAEWQDNRDLFLGLEYNLVCANPMETMKQIAKHINTADFMFDVDLAARAIDPSLYIDRSVQLPF